jgi:hypothetical protein
MTPPFLRVELFDPGEYCADGLRRRESPVVTVPWSRISRVAWGYELSPYAIADWDFWAFQTEDPSVTYWIYVEPNSPISDEIHRRFEVGDAPAMGEWADRDMSIRACVVWPPAELGRPLYQTVKRHWWSWSGKLVYASVDPPTV